MWITSMLSQWATPLLDHSMPFVQWGVVLGASLAGALSDLAKRRIPNWLTGPVLIAGLLFAAWIGSVGGVADALGGCLLLALPYVLLFIFAGGGAGDAKLMGALGAWLGLIQGAIVLVLVVMVGAVLGIAFALAKRQLRPVMGRLGRVLTDVGLYVTSRGRFKMGEAISVQEGEMVAMPYGIAIFAGVLIASIGLVA